jgi:hypothetical protein
LVQDRFEIGKCCELRYVPYSTDLIRQLQRTQRLILRSHPAGRFSRSGRLSKSNAIAIWKHPAQSTSRAATAVVDRRRRAPRAGNFVGLGVLARPPMTPLKVGSGRGSASCAWVAHEQIEAKAATKARRLRRTETHQHLPANGPQIGHPDRRTRRLRCAPTAVQPLARSRRTMALIQLFYRI